MVPVSALSPSLSCRYLICIHALLALEGAVEEEDEEEEEEEEEKECWWLLLLSFQALLC